MGNLTAINFIDKMEIRMGSPFNHCKVEVKGLTLPELSVETFQDIYNWADDYEYLGLVKWNINDNNEPGFNIFVVDVNLE